MPYMYNPNPQPGQNIYDPPAGGGMSNNKSGGNGIWNTLGMIGGAMQGPQGFAIMALTNIAGGILSAFTSNKPEKSAAEVQYEKMVNYYYNLGKRSKLFESAASAITGQPQTAFAGKFPVPSVDSVIARYSTNAENTNG